MAYIDVTAWSPDHVVAWLRGLHQSLEKASFNQIIKNRVNGNRLMMLVAQDIVDLIPKLNVEALHTIVGGIASLRYLNTTSRVETLQSLNLNLACHAKYLYNQLIQAEQSPRLLPVSTTLATPMTGTSKNRFDFAKVDSNMQINQSTKQRVSLETLDSVSIIVDQILHVVQWLNSSGLTDDVKKFHKEFKSVVLRVAVELTSTAQRDQFVEQPNDVIKKTSKFLADYCEWVVLAIDDPNFILPCWLDIVSVKKKSDETDFGIVMQSSKSGFLLIEDVLFSSPAHRSGRISVGDEVVQIDYQTVVAWPLEKVRDTIQSYTSEVILTIKKKPTQSLLNPSIVVMKTYAIPLKKMLSLNPDSTTKEPEHSDSVLVTNIYVEAAPDSTEESLNFEPPKEPKGPVYELQPPKPHRELKRRVSISGSISDALVDLSLADSLPIPSVEKPRPQVEQKTRSTKLNKETLTKSVSHDTAKLYLHTLSIDRKYLWFQQSSKGSQL